MSHSHPQPNQHQWHVVTALTALGGGAVVFLFGFLNGRLTEPVPGMPGGVAGLSWLTLSLIVAAVVATLVTVHRALRRPPRAEDRSEEFAYMETVLSQCVEHVGDEAEKTRLPEPLPPGTAASTASGGDNLHSALDDFPAESPAPRSSSSS